MSNARVVDEDVEGLVQSANEGEKVVDRVGAADVAGLRQDLNSELLQLRASLNQSMLVAAGDDQIASPPRERAGDGETDATVGAGDEG
jgi:hypothetical protein